MGVVAVDTAHLRAFLEAAAHAQASELIRRMDACLAGGFLGVEMQIEVVAERLAWPERKRFLKGFCGRGVTLAADVMPSVDG